MQNIRLCSLTSLEVAEEFEYFLLDDMIGGCPDGSAGKEPTVNAGDARGTGLIPGLGRSPGEGNGNPL